MKSVEGIRVSVGEKAYLDNGFQVSVQALTPMRQVTPSETAYHEAEHAVVTKKRGKFVKRVTIIPGPGYYGLTETSQPDAVAAVAPHANGRGGTGHDLYVVQALGSNVDSVASVARGILASSREEIEAVASELEENKTLNDQQITEAMGSVEKGMEVVIFIKTPAGEEQSITKRYFKDPTVIVPEEWISFPKAA